MKIDLHRANTDEAIHINIDETMGKIPDYKIDTVASSEAATLYQALYSHLPMSTWDAFINMISEYINKRT